MANFQFRPIYDTTANILDENKYPLIEGQVFFATDVNKLFVDVDGHRAAQTQLSSITNLGENISEVFQQGVKGFEGQILVGRSGTGYRLFYVDLNSVAHNLTFTAEKLGDLTERVSYQGGALSYAGNWATGKQYFADRLRTSVVRFNGDYYYAVESHTAGATFAGDAAKWTKFSIQFESVATGLLLAENAVITKTLTLGQEGTDQGTIRSANATALNTGSGLFMSNASNGVFRIGNPSGNFIRWDGSTLTINGTIAVGNISGLGDLATQNSVDYGTQVTGTRPPANADSTSTVISNGLVTTGSLVVVQGGTVAAGITGNTSGDTAVRIFAGSSFANRTSAPFRVTQAGALVASNATITGAITATSGKIGDWNIDTQGLSDSTGATQIKPGLIRFGFNANLSVDIDGQQINFRNSGIIGSFNGNITGSQGKLTIKTRNNLELETQIGTVVAAKGTSQSRTFREVPGAEISGGNVLTIYLD